MFEVDHLDLEENTPLHLASANGSENLVVDLIMRGVEVDASNSFGWTPLMQAARNGHRSIVSILLKHGAHQEKRNKYGLTPLLLASVSGDVETVTILLNSGAIYELNEMCLISPLMIASLYKNQDVVRLFLNYKLDANSLFPKTEISPIMCAAAGGSVAIVKMLVEQGSKADNASNLKGFSSALESAILCNNLQVVDYFEKFGKRLENKDKLFNIVEATAQDKLDTVYKVSAKHPTQAKNMEPLPLWIDTNHERTSLVTPISQPFSQVSINEPTVSDPSQKMHRRTSFSYSPEPHPASFPSQHFAELDSPENAEPDIFAQLSKIQTDFLKTMKPPRFEETMNSKEMPPGSLVNLAKQSFSFDRLTKKYTKPSLNRCLPEVLGDIGAHAKSSCKSPLAFPPQECTVDQHVTNVSMGEILQELLEMMHT